MAKKLKALLALMLTLVMVLYMWPVGVAANEQALSDTLQAGENQTVELPQVLPELDNDESNGGPVVLPELDNGENNGGPVVLPELDNGAANGILGEDDEESIYVKEYHLMNQKDYVNYCQEQANASVGSGHKATALVLNGISITDQYGNETARQADITGGGGYNVYGGYNLTDHIQPDDVKEIVLYGTYVDSWWQDGWIFRFAVRTFAYPISADKLNFQPYSGNDNTQAFCEVTFSNKPVEPTPTEDMELIITYSVSGLDNQKVSPVFTVLDDAGEVAGTINYADMTNGSFTLGVLEAGTYTVQISNTDVVGYTCSTVSDPADGTVTVEENKTPTIHFASTYTKVEQPPAEPAQLIITKTIHGIDKLPDSFRIEIEGATEHTLDTTTASHVDNVYTWKVALPEGEYTVEETGYAVEGYSVTPCVDNKENCAKSIVAMPDDYNISIHFTNTYTKNEQPTEKAPVLEIEKTANVSSMTVGSQVTYTITVSNTGDAQATDVTVTDILPDGLSYVSSTNGGIHSNGMITWDLGVLNAGDFRVMTVTAQAEKTGSLVNTAEVDCNELTVITDEATVSVTTSGGGGGGPVTPDPDPDEEVNITDPETPLGPGPDEEVEIPEEETPLAPNPDEEVEIGDEETPLAPAPEETVIDDAQVPLATLPQTGAIGMKLDPAMAAGALILAVALTAAGVTVTKTSGKKKED